MNDPSQRRRLDPEAILRMSVEERAERRKRMIDGGPPELRGLRIEMAALWDSAVAALDARRSLKHHIDRLRRAGMAEDALQSKEESLSSASEKVELIKSKVVELQARIEQETRELEFAQYAPGNRHEAARLITERDEAIGSIRPSELERQAGRVAGAQLRLMSQIYLKPETSHEPGRLAELEQELLVLKVKMAEVDQALADRMTRIEAVRADYDARLQHLRELGETAG